MSDSITEPLSHKLGPLPVGVWGVAVLAGLGVAYFVRRQSLNTPDTTAVDTTGAYGASAAKPGCIARAATVQVKMRPRPLARVHDQAAELQRAQISRGKPASARES